MYRYVQKQAREQDNAQKVFKIHLKRKNNMHELSDYRQALLCGNG